MEKGEYSIYDIITMTPGMAGEVLDDEINKDNPDIELIKNILDHSQIEDVNLRTKKGSTLLIWTLQKGHIEIARTLLDRPEIDVNLQGRWGETALIDASANGQTEIVQLLLDRPDIDVKLKTNEGQNALTWAKWKGHTDVVDLLKK